MSNHEKVKGNEEIHEGLQKKKIEIIKLMSRNKAAALGLAVLLTVSPALALSGCNREKYEEKKSQDPNQEQKGGGQSYYHGGGGGGSYYYSNGGTYRNGSWGKNFDSSRIGGYSAPRAGGIGG